MIRRIVFLFLSLLGMVGVLSAQRLKVEGLTCEYIKNPIGIDIKNPFKSTIRCNFTVNGLSYENVLSSQFKRWSGKKVNCLGDSITYGSGGKSWTYFIGDLIGASEVRNYGVSGSSIQDDGRNQGFINRYSNMDNDADLIICDSGLYDSKINYLEYAKNQLFLIPRNRADEYNLAKNQTLQKPFLPTDFIDVVKRILVEIPKSTKIVAPKPSNIKVGDEFGQIHTSDKLDEFSDLGSDELLDDINKMLQSNLYISQILKEHNADVYLGGNIGYPVCSLVDKVKDNSILVLEISGHQLHDCHIFKTNVSAFLKPSR